MSKINPTVVIVMPAYNAEKTVRETFKEIPPKYRKNIILVDDNSKDNTVDVAKKLGIKVFAHPNNLGYGGNQKTCYWEALKLNPDVVVMLHPDYQYDASVMEDLVEPILQNKYDFMFGSRIITRGGALAGGMPMLKYFINRIDTVIENILLGINFSEHFSGYRAFSKKLLMTIPFQRFSNDFVFDQEMKVSSISYGFKIGEIPIETRYHEKSSSIQFLKGVKFLLETYYVIVKYYFHVWGIKKSRLFALRKK
jgi:glycosyltransferase involved in cell wall biosynthesis